MNKKQIYNKGVESGLKVSQKIIEQEVEAMGYLKGKINLIVDGHDEMKDAVNRLIKDADDDAISNLFHVCNTATPSELKEHEKKVLLSVLATLSKNMINENQRQYQNNLRHHINMKGYQPDSDYDFKSIATLESVKSIKVIAKAVRVFLYLENDSMDSVFQYDEELFSHFEIRGFDEIDAQIELLVHLFGNKGLIELYGDYENKGDFVQKDLSFLHPKEKEYVEINRECAHIYFKDCYSYDEGLKYIESSSFIIFSSGNKIMKLNKVTGVADILLSNIEKASIYIDKKKISTYFDMVYYVMNNDLHYFNLETDATGIIAHIPEEKNAEGELYEIRELSIYKGKKVIYQNGYRHYIMDMEVGTNPISFSVGSESDNYFIKGDYLFYVDMESDIDDLDHTKYVIKKYGLINNQATTISKPFGKHKALDVDGQQ